MAAITAALIKQVREDTGAGMLDVKKALTEAEGDVARAKEIIRAKGIAAAGKREGRKAQEAVSSQATRVNMPYVSERWLGGMLTNFQTVSKRVNRLKELEEMDFTDVHGSGLTKKELLLLEREKDKLNKQLGGIRNMNRTPSAMFVVDITKEALAVEEAHKLGIPVVAIVDTNADPDTVEYPIPANDDAIRGIELLTSLMADAVAEGLLERSGANKAEGEAAEQPMAAWEKELLTNEAPAEAEAAAPAAAEETAEAPKAE